MNNFRQYQATDYSNVTYWREYNKLNIMNNRYQNMVNRMAQRVKLGYILVRPNYSIDNAHATHDQNTGQMLIEYNPNFMTSLEEYSKWAAMMVIAHEVGHHHNLDLYGRFSGIDRSSHMKEYNADWFAGWMLRCEGARMDQATDVYETYNFVLSKSHPDEATRVGALKHGWVSADCKINPPHRVTRTQKNNDVGKALFGAAAGFALILAIGAIIKSV
ncbi:MAG: hypothetical protein ACJ04Q_03340 [Flavobacteriales bacterium]